MVLSIKHLNVVSYQRYLKSGSTRESNTRVCPRSMVRKVMMNCMVILIGDGEDIAGKARFAGPLQPGLAFL